VHGEVCDGNIRTEGCTLLGGHPGIKIQECKSDCKSFGGLGNCVTPEKCGDGIKNGTEETCDEGPFNGGPLCRDDCTKCGDGKLQGWHDEVCDDNNNLMDDGCNASCELEPFNFTTPVPDTETIYLADVGDYTYNVDVSTEGDNDNIRYGLIISPVPVAPMFSINETNGTISNISTAGDGTFEINIIAYDRFLGAMSDPDLMVAGSVQQIMTKKQTFSLTVLRCGDGAIQVCSDLAISDPALCVGDLVLLEQCDDSNSNSGDGCDACLLEPFDINPSGLTEVFIDEPTWAGQTFTLTFPALGANWQISSLPDWLELTVVSADEALLDFDTVSYLVIPDDIPIPELVNSFGSVTITVADIIGGAEISATKTFDLRTLLAKYMIYGMVTNPMIPGQPPVEGAILVLTDETGAVVQTVTTNVGGPNPGKYEFLDVPHRESPENYTIDASGPVAGYTPVHDAGLSGTGFELTSDVEKNYVMWVGLGAENNTIVLKWGDLPADLDAHIYYNGGGHIYHRNKNIGGDISLDLDNTYQKGPETITIDSLFSDFTYTYVVRNYGNPSERRIPASYPPEEKTCPDDPTGNVYECECCEAGTCNSKPDFEDARDGGLSVEVYNPGNLLIKVFEINEFTTGEFKSCNWEVFSIDGATGEITEINKLQCEPSRKCEWDGSGEACVGTFRHYSSSASCTNASDCNVRYGCNWSTGVCGAKSSGWDLGTCEANCVINIMCRRSNGTCYAAPGTPSYGNPEACTAVCQEETYFRCHSGGCSKWTCNDPVNCLGNCECDNLDDCTGVTSCPDCGACPGDPPPGPSCPANCGCPNEDACPYGCDSTCGK